MFDYAQPNRDLLRRFFQLTVFNVLSNITEPLAGLLSVAFLGHLTDINDLAGVSLAIVLFNFIYDNLLILRVSTTAMTAQAVGRNDSEEILLVGLRNTLIALVMGLLILILNYPLGKLGFAFLNGSEEVTLLGLSYFNARIWGIPIVLINFVIIGWFLGREQSAKVLLLTATGNISNVIFSYFAIIRWHLGSTGAGLSQVASEYLTLLVGILLVSFSIDWTLFPKVIGKFWNWSALKAIFIFNRDLLFQTLVYTFIWIIFFNLSAGLGTEILAENTLLQQIIYLIMFIVEGIGFTTETLTGNFQGQLANEKLLPLLQISLLTSLSIGIATAVTCLLFPEIVFGLLTNHSEIIEQVKHYTPWLFLILCSFSIAWILEGYFAGLTKGHFLRNAALAAIFLGFTPAAFWAWSAHNNHILWLAISVFMVTRMVALIIQLFQIVEISSRGDVSNLDQG